jgi:hypothetical protein
MICLHHDSISQGIIPTLEKLCPMSRNTKSYSFLITNFIVSKSKRTKGQEIIDKTLHGQLQIEQHEPVVNSCAPSVVGSSCSTSDTVVLLLNDTNII